MMWLDDDVLRDSVRWLERGVIGLNLCPFAKAVHNKGQIHWCVSHAADASDLLVDLERELTTLANMDGSVRDTTLLVAPAAFADFLDFNDFLAGADALLRRLGLDVMLQIASFHPQFQFAGTDTDDVTNATNRSPYPTLHLIRESSMDRAVNAFPQAESIYEVNIETLERLGPAGWRDLDVGAGAASRNRAPGEK